MPETFTNPQLMRDGELRHLLSIEELSRDILTHVLGAAQQFVSVSDPDREAKKVPPLRGKSVFNLFPGNSTCTRTTLGIAAKRLSADAISLNINASPTSKGESLLDTVSNLPVVQTDMSIVWHAGSGVPYLITEHVAPHAYVINAGDGRHTHPTQELLDMFTIRHYKKGFSNLTVTIVGDILHSRVTRSDTHVLTTLGCAEVHAIGPYTLLPGGLERMDVRVFHNMEEGLKDADVAIVLCLQNEHMSGALLPPVQEYFKAYGLTQDCLALIKPDVIIMHPGLMNCGVGVNSAAVDGVQSVILNQVTFGIAVCVTVMDVIVGNND